MNAEFVPAAAWLAAGHQGGSGSVLGRIVLVAVAVLAVGAFTVLQIMARSRGWRPPPVRRRYWLDASDWRTLPPGPEAGAGEREATPAAGERYGPDWRYGYPPGSGARGSGAPGRGAGGPNPGGRGGAGSGRRERGVPPPRTARDDAMRGWSR